MFEDSFLIEVFLIVLLLVLAIIILPLILGIFIAVSYNLLGLDYYGCVIVTACIIWLILFVLWKLDFF